MAIFGRMDKQVQAAERAYRADQAAEAPAEAETVVKVSFDSPAAGGVDDAEGVA